MISLQKWRCEAPRFVLERFSAREIANTREISRAIEISTQILHSDVRVRTIFFLIRKEKEKEKRETETVRVRKEFYGKNYYKIFASKEQIDILR